MLLTDDDGPTGWGCETTDVQPRPEEVEADGRTEGGLGRTEEVVERKSASLPRVDDDDAT